MGLFAAIEPTKTLAVGDVIPDWGGELIDLLTIAGPAAGPRAPRAR
jgi:hypothetical protein